MNFDRRKIVGVLSVLLMPGVAILELYRTRLYGVRSRGCMAGHSKTGFLPKTTLSPFPDSIGRAEQLFRFCSPFKGGAAPMS